MYFLLRALKEATCSLACSGVAWRVAWRVSFIVTNIRGVGELSPLSFIVATRVARRRCLAHQALRSMGTHLPLALQSPPDPEDEGEVLITAEMLCASAARWRGSMAKVPALAVPEVGSRASSGRACQLCLARVLELDASEAADFPAFDHSGAARCGSSSRRSSSGSRSSR